MAGGRGIQVHRLPQEEGSSSSYIDHVRWLSSSSSFIIAATNPNSKSSSSYLQTLSLNPTNTTPPKVQSTWVSPSRITSLSVSPSLVAVSTSSGSLHLIPTTNSIDPSQTLSYSHLHNGPVSSLDMLLPVQDSNSASCLTVGDDGRINLVTLEGKGQDGVRRVWDSDGLVGYNAVRWASPTEFVTGGFRFGLQWWDLRKPGCGPVALFKPSSWPHRAASGIVHSIDIHTSRKHTCLAGGSAGTVFAWDLRWQHQPIILSGVGLVDKTTQSPSESEVWKVQYDNYTSSLDMGNISSSRILPAMICSEDGILAVVEEGEEPYELLAEPCAINSFDINQENPSDVICSLEWESIAVVTRQ